MVLEVPYETKLLNDFNVEPLFENQTDYFDNEIEYMQYLDIVNYLPDDLLVKTDRASMYSSLETRAPFLNQNILKIAFNMEDLNYARSSGKLPLKKILNKYLDKKLYDRPKEGFGVPLSSWFRNELKDWLHSQVYSKKLSGIIDLNYFQLIFDKHIKGKMDYSEILWRYSVLYNWYDKKSF